jgi:ketosteroid isomerase-like protein
MEATLLDRLCRAINSHDLEGIAACFAEDYRCDIPLHPARSFTGRDQVRANWAPLLKGVPDLTATVVRQTAGDGTEWGEWEQRGTVVDGSPHLVRGVVIFTVAGELVQSARFYLEPVDEAEPA